MKQENKIVGAFENGSIPKVVIKNCIPALIAMVMVMIYNIADIFFIGLTGDDFQVAAVSLASPVFMIFISLGTLFGVGGSSAISRALGAGKTDYAKKVSAFCFWSCVIVAALIMTLLWVFMEKIIIWLGASPDTIDFTRSYLSITTGCGAFSMCAVSSSNIVRAEGQPMRAMTGTMIGNLLNVILDPVMILGFGWGITGAAIATVIGNFVGVGYYILYFTGKKSVLSIHPRYFSVRENIPGSVISVGLSASLANLLVSITSIIVNGQLALFDDMYVAGYGVTSKIMMVVTLVGIGMGGGIQPLLGYCYGAKKRERLIGSMRFAAGFGLAICIFISLICYLFAGPIVRVFLTTDEAYGSAVHFTRILMSTAWLIGAFSIFQSALQGMGAAVPALLSSLFRQGIIFIPAMFILKSIIGLDGLIWAQPTADVLSFVFVVIMTVRKIQKTDFTALPEEA